MKKLLKNFKAFIELHLLKKKQNIILVQYMLKFSSNICMKK